MRIAVPLWIAMATMLFIKYQFAPNKTGDCVLQRTIVVNCRTSVANKPSLHFNRQ